MPQRDLRRDVSKAFHEASRLYFLLNKYPKFPASALLLNPSFIVLFSTTRFAFGDIRTFQGSAKT